jgi:hypothetical protein
MTVFIGKKAINGNGNCLGILKIMTVDTIVFVVPLPQKTV